MCRERREGVVKRGRLGDNDKLRGGRRREREEERVGRKNAREIHCKGKG